MSELLDEIAIYIAGGLNFYSQAWLAALSDDLRSIHVEILDLRRNLWEEISVQFEEAREAHFSSPISGSLIELRGSYEAALQDILGGGIEPFSDLLTAERQYLSFLRLRLMSEEGSPLEVAVDRYSTAFLDVLRKLELETGIMPSGPEAFDLFPDFKTPSNVRPQASAGW